LVIEFCFVFVRASFAKLETDTTNPHAHR